MMAVRIEMGISGRQGARERIDDDLSAGPSSSVTRMTARLFLPARHARAVPTQATWPHIEMTEAVMTVEAMRTRQRLR